MSPAHERQIAAAFNEPMPTALTGSATDAVRTGAMLFSRVLADHCPPGRHLNKALQLVEMAYLVARQGIETAPPVAPGPPA